VEAAVVELDILRMAPRTKRKVGGGRVKPMPRAERRIQLLAVARDIIRDEGIGSLTMSALAERTGAVKPVVYEHFQNSEAVAVALMDDHVQRSTSFVVARVEKAKTIYEYIDIMVDALFDFQAEEHFHLRSITNGLTSNFTEINRVYSAYRTMSVDVFKSLLRQQGIDRNASHVAAVGIQEMLSGTVFEFSGGALERAARRTLKNAIRGMVLGLMTEAGAKPVTPMNLLGPRRK
jgi:AcrR family transcriptional regulator